MTWFSEKMLISTRCICGFMPNLLKKSWLVSNTYVKRLRSLSDSEYWEQESVRTCTRAEGADGLGFWVRKGGKTGEYSNKVIGIGFPASPIFRKKRKNSTCPLFLYYLANSSCCYCMPNRLAFTKHKDELERHAIYDNPRVLSNLSKKEFLNFCHNLWKLKLVD